MKALLINPSNRVGIEELTYTDVIESIQEIKKFL